MPVVQDGPPPGGFPSVRYARRVPSTGPTGLTLFAVGSVVMAYGFYRVGQGNHARREEKQEIFRARKALIPFLQAEEDRRWVKSYSEFSERQQKALKNVSWERYECSWCEENITVAIFQCSKGVFT